MMTQLLDLDTFRANIDHDEAMEHMLLKLYLESSDDAMEQLRIHMAQGTTNEKQWQDGLHFLKGAALNVVAVPFAALLESAQTQATSHKQKQQYFAQISADYVLLRNIIAARLAEFT